MRDLFVVAEESTDALWVLRTFDGERFSIPRADLLPPADAASDVHTDVDADSGEFGADSGFHSESTDYDYMDSADTADIVEAEIVDAELVDDTPTDLAATGTSAAEDVAGVRELSQPAERTPAEPDPLFATPLSLRPKEIQARIRAGATTEELASEMGVAESRVEPYAHPVLLERAQVADAAKQSHPVRGDGPAPDTLFEILALTFASRGHALSEATWDAVREAGEPWVVRVTWQAGLQEHSAEWFFRRAMGGSATTEPRDAVAADLIDPSFAQPVRSLSAVAPGYRTEPLADELQPIDDTANEYPHDSHGAEYVERPEQTARQNQPDLFAEGEFLQAPDETEKPQKRKRKAVTPHWEDVLLGVRTNTKRPK